ncbi:hypothetical protein [Limosilactobacillus reuteri]|uniref:hypothetical protein n=1 Tax=Limosilactobacillus reuteri TaxID=1598 RepID=UPI003CFCB030
MQDNEILKRYLNRIKETKDIEYKRSLLYSAYTVLLLSTEYFKLNVDIKEFLTPVLEKLDKFINPKKSLVFKDYVYKSRSLIIARFIRIIQHSNQETLNILINSISILFESDESNIGLKSQKKERKNSVDELLTRFGRK